MKKVLIFFVFSITLSYNGFVLAQDNRDAELNLARQYFSEGRNFLSNNMLDSAIYKFQDASSIFSKYEQWQNYLITQYYLCQILTSRSQFDQASFLYNQMIDKAKEHNLDSTKLMAATYAGLGQIYFYLGKYDDAKQILEQALNLNKKLFGENSIEAANIYTSLGNVYARIGNYSTALTYYLKDLQIKQQLLGENNKDLSTIYNNIGVVYSNLGQHKKALAFLEKSVRLAGGDNELNPEIANTYSQIGSIYIDMFNIDAAMSYILKSIEIKKKLYGEDNFKLVDDYIKLGIIYKYRNKFDDAFVYYNNALEIATQTLPENHPDLAGMYNNLAEIMRIKRLYSAALEYYNAALKIDLLNFGENHPDVAAIYNNMGALYYTMKKFDKAAEYQKKSIEIYTKKFGEYHPILIQPYINLGRTYFDIDSLSLAALFLQKSIICNVKDFSSENIYDNPPLKDYYDGIRLITALNEKGQALYKMYVNDSLYSDIEAALNTILTADTLVTIKRQSNISTEDKLLVGQNSYRICEAGINIALALDQRFKDEKYRMLAYYFSERNKASTLLEAITSSEAQTFAGIPDSLIEVERRLSEQISVYEKKLAELSNTDDELIVRQELFKLKKQYSDLVSMFEKKYPKYYELKYTPVNINVKELQQIIDKNTAIQSYFVGSEAIVIYTITKDNFYISTRKLPKNFESDVVMFTMSISKPTKESLPTYNDLGYKLYNILFPYTLPRNINRLLIIPDGILGTFPFEALLTDSIQKNIKLSKYPYLINKYSVSYSYSSSLYYKLFSKTDDYADRPLKDWLGIAPVFDKVKSPKLNGTSFSPIPATETELDTIYYYFRLKMMIADILLRDKAKESAIKSGLLDNYKIVHIATHGYVNSEHPELSCLAFTADDQGQDGLLYSGEIYNIKLNSDLVVLSACETGVGKVSKGEGVIGLSRSLIYAGSKNLIVSLWKVADISTSLLMISFYKNIIKHNVDFEKLIKFSDDLADAKRQMIKSKKFSHPFFWSAFILIGR